MMNQPCPICEWEDSVIDDDSACLCESCGARFEIEADAELVGEDWRDCSTVGKRIADPDALKESEFQLRESPAGTHAVVEGGRYKGEYVKLVEDRPYIQNAWACLRTGRLYHYSFLLDHVWGVKIDTPLTPLSS